MTTLLVSEELMVFFFASKYIFFYNTDTLTSLLVSEALQTLSLLKSKFSIRINQGLFCHDQVSSGKILDFFNL